MVLHLPFIVCLCLFTVCLCVFIVCLRLFIVCLRMNGGRSVEEVPRQAQAEDEAVYGVVGREEGAAAP